MAVLSDSERGEGTAEYMRTNRDALALTKGDLRAAYNALDVYLNDNASAINTAIPQPARAALSAAQKALLLMAVVTRRYVVGV